MNLLKNIFLTADFYLFFTNVPRAKAHINIWWSYDKTLFFCKVEKNSYVAIEKNI